MRLSLFYNPLDLIDRLGIAVRRHRRLRRLRHTPAAGLGLAHIGSLELLEMLATTPPGVIYDIGANVGTWSLLAKALYPAARIEAFEPLALHTGGFHQRMASFTDSVRLHSCALGASEGTAEMNIMDFSDASSLLPLTAAGQDEFHLRPVAKQSVPVVPLDTLVRRENLPPPDLLKLDVQGYELEVLRGAETCLAHARVVICEASFHTYYAAQPLFAELVAFLAQRGYTLQALGEGTALGRPLVQADALFLRTTADRK